MGGFLQTPQNKFIVSELLLLFWLCFLRTANFINVACEEKVISFVLLFNISTKNLAVNFKMQNFESFSLHNK